MAECLDKNMIDKNEYPNTAVAPAVVALDKILQLRHQREARTTTTEESKAKPALRAIT
jgi:hypothetical protein